MCVVLAILAGLWQVDLVRQNAELFWLSVSGQRWKLHGRLAISTVWSPALRQSRRVAIYLPHDYAENPSRRYPVLYLLHGSPGVLDDWVRYGRAPEDLEQLWSQGRIPETILVMPDGQGMGYLGDSEYLDAPNGRGRSGTAVGTFIWRDLPSWMDRHYRTIASRDGRSLGGVSTGGYGAVNLGMQHPDLFGSLYSFSGYFQAEDSGWARPVWGYHPDPNRMRQESPLSFVATGGNPLWRKTFIYIGEGADERPPYPQESRAFCGSLDRVGIPYVHRTLPGKHSWDLWRSALRDAMLSREQMLHGSALPGRH